MTLLEKLKKNSKLAGTDILSESEFFGDPKPVSTPVPMLNVALSGELNGGLTSGHTMLAGASKHFKCVRPDTPLVVYVID